MHRGHRLVAGLTAVLAVPAVLALPVITGPQAAIRPVTPTVETLALDGIDPAGLASSQPPSALPADDDHSHDDVVVAGPVAVAHEDDHAVQPAEEPQHDASTAQHGDQRSGQAPADVHAEEPAVDVEAAAVTAPTDTEPFTLVAVDWEGSAEPGTVVQVRVRNDGAWSPWQQLVVNAEHGPDPGSEEAADVRSGTEPLLVEPGSDGVQVRVDAPDGELPADAQVSLIDPQQSEADVLAAQTPVSTAAAAGDPLRPSIITRAQWGADESLRSRGPIYTGTLKAGFLHHTASTSDYTPEQAAAQVRALYAYFTLSLGYSDIAYNFFVDRYGRLYEGRYGGMDKNVLGGHTAGFNENTFAVSAIGNFETYKPTSGEYTAMQTAVSRLFAWKFALNHVDPTGTTTLVSNSGAGTSNYSSGTSVTVPTVMGHGDIGSTACPGRYIETMVPSIRTQARAFMRTQLLSPSMSSAVLPYGSTGQALSVRTTTPAAWKLEIFSVCSATPIRTITGTQSAAGALKVAWDGRTGSGTVVRPGTYSWVLSASNGSDVAYPVRASSVVTETPTSPVGPCAKAGRVGSTDRAAASVRAGALVAPTSRTVVIAPASVDAEPIALIAAPLAGAKGAPLLLTGSSALPSSVAADIARRAVTTAYVVGTSTQISSAVVSQLASLGVRTITRITGTSRAGLAANVAREMGVKGRAVVASFDSTASRDLAAAAAAGASAAGRPLLVVGATSVPADTAAVMSQLAITSTTVVGPAAAVSDAVVAAVKGVRVSASTDAATSTALVKALAPTASRVSLLPVGSGYGRAVAAGMKRPLVLGAGGTAGIAAWIAGTSVASALAVAPTTVWSDASLGAVATAISGTSTGTSSTVASVPAAAAPTAGPSSFQFNGSGWGHGVGMSQYGARGQALEGRTAEEIVRYYYTGTTVAPVPDDMNIRVNLQTRRTIAVFRTESLAAGGGGLKVAVTKPVDGVSTTVASYVGTTADTFTVKAAGSGNVTVQRTRAGVTTTIGSGTRITVNWAGTRYPAGTGTGATVLNIASSVSNLSTTGHRYRYGYAFFDSSTASPATFEVVNALRLGDEYMLGLAEVSNSWPAAALQAQVLAARSYALVKVTAGERSSCLCHVDDGGGPFYDQTFAGYEKETSALGANWVAAVRATETAVTVDGKTTTQGKAVLYGGKPIQAFYFSASGGRTQSSQEVWVATVPYLQSVADPWSLDASVPWSRWTARERTQAQVAAAFGLPDVVRIDLGQRTAGTGVKSAVAWSSAGVSATITGEQLRSRLSLPSTWVARVAEKYTGSAVSVAVSRASASASSTVVLAPHQHTTTAAVAASLSAVEGWPLLLTSSSGATSTTKDELARRGKARATTVYAVGTVAELPTAVLDVFEALPGITVKRVSGADDSAVSVAAAKLSAPAAGTPVVVASAVDSFGAMAASGAAGALRRPLLLVPGGSMASAAVTAYVRDVLKPTSTLVVGTTSAVADSVVLGFASPTRVAGSTAGELSSRLVQVLPPAAVARVAASAPADTTAALAATLASAPGVPLIFVDATPAAAARQALQRGTHTVVQPPSVADATAWLLRRA